MSGFRPRRALGIAAVLGVACWALLAVSGSTQHARATPLRAEAPAASADARFWYFGSEDGSEDLYGFVSPAKPFAKTGHLSWEWQWDMTCGTKTGELAIGTQFGCAAPVRISGWEKQTFLYAVSGQNCTAKITSRKDAQWAVGAYVVTRTGIHLAASPPEPDFAVSPSPPDSNCKGIDDAIEWKFDSPNISEVVNGPYWWSASVAALGNYTGTAPGPAVRGHAASSSSMDLTLGRSASVSRVVANILADLTRRLADSVASWRDQLNADVPVSGLFPPSTYLETSGTLSGQGAPAGSQRFLASAGTGTLFTIRQHVRSGFTRVTIRLTAAGKRFLAKAGAAKIRISLTFKPTHGAASTVRRVVRLRPPLPS